MLIIIVGFRFRVCVCVFNSKSSGLSENSSRLTRIMNHVKVAVATHRKNQMLQRETQITHSQWHFGVACAVLVHSGIYSISNQFQPLLIISGSTNYNELVRKINGTLSSTHLSYAPHRKPTKLTQFGVTCAHTAAHRMRIIFQCHFNRIVCQMI